MSEEKFRNKYRIPSARAAWHDYQGGMYFVTICTQNREHFFGEIVYDENKEAKMNYTELGNIAMECWKSIPLHFPHAEAPLWVVMPNHIHGIIIIHKLGNATTVAVETQIFASLPENGGNHFGPQSKNLASIVRGFKIGVTKHAREKGIFFAWQPRYHDHIVRDFDEMNRIADYIETNPARWAQDKLNDSVFAEMPEMMK